MGETVNVLVQTFVSDYNEYDIKDFNDDFIENYKKDLKNRAFYTYLDGLYFLTVPLFEIQHLIINQFREYKSDKLVRIIQNMVENRLFRMQNNIVKDPDIIVTVNYYLPYDSNAVSIAIKKDLFDKLDIGYREIFDGKAKLYNDFNYVVFVKYAQGSEFKVD